MKPEDVFIKANEMREHNPPRRVVYDIWIDNNKEYNKEDLSNGELISLFEENPHAVIRVRMFWEYGSKPERRLTQEFLINMPLVNGTGTALDGVDAETEEKAAAPAIQNNTPAVMMNADNSNPLSWILTERTSQLDEAKRDLREAKEKIETLREKNESLEREIIKKDHTISDLTHQNEEGSGLNGFLSSNPTIAEKAIEVLGPGLMNLLQRPAGEIGTSNPIIKDIEEWLNNLPEEDQLIFRSIVVAIARRHKVNPEFLQILDGQLNKTKNDKTEEDNGITLRRSG